jgi:hypothetical protein
MLKLGMSARRYRLVVEGELGPRYAAAFDGMTICAHDGETDITGPIIDQSHLQGLLERIASLGLKLYSLTPLEPDNAKADPQPHARRAGVYKHSSSTDSKGP